MRIEHEYCASRIMYKLVKNLSCGNAMLDYVHTYNPERIINTISSSSNYDIDMHSS
jgi:hypothetical protein